MQLKPIGTIKSPFLDKFGTPRQSLIAKKSVSRILFDKKIISSAMLVGLKIGDPIWVLFHFHLNNQKKTIAKVHPPRLKGKKIGVLASRSPHRPNPIGLSLGYIHEVGNNHLDVLGLDIVNNTPIIDIKPYLPIFDRPKKLKTAEWIEKNPFTKLKVQFAKSIQWPIKNNQTLKQQLKEILQEDPRPLAYFSKTNHQYWMKYNVWDIGFTIKNTSLTVNYVISLKDKKNGEKSDSLAIL